jgi:nucleotide-binding universal stress UspA family protein
MLKILLPTDFSSSSYNAILYALNMLKGFEVEFEVLHVIFQEDEKDGALIELSDHAEKQFALLKSDLVKDHAPIPANFTFHIAHGFQVSHIIHEYADRHNKDMIIVGARGELNSEQVILGGRTCELITISEIPVLSIPKSASFKKIRNTIYATDLTDIDFEAGELIAFARLFNASVHFVHVFPQLLGTTLFNPTYITNDLIKKFSYANITFDAIMNNDVEQALTDFIDEKKPDIVAMFTHKRNLLEQFFNKSITKSIAFQVSTPLFTFKKR